MFDQEFKPFALTGYEEKLEREKQFDLKRTVIDIKINFEERGNARLSQRHTSWKGTS